MCLFLHLILSKYKLHLYIHHEKQVLLVDDKAVISPKIIMLYLAMY